MARKLRPALEIVSDIGALGFDLQHHDDVQIAAAVAVLRTVNEPMFDYLVRVLAAVPPVVPPPPEGNHEIQTASSESVPLAADDSARDVADRLAHAALAAPANRDHAQAVDRVAIRPSLAGLIAQWREKHRVCRSDGGYDYSYYGEYEECANELEALLRVGAPARPAGEHYWFVKVGVQGPNVELEAVSQLHAAGPVPTDADREQLKALADEAWEKLSQRCDLARRVCAERQ